MFAATRVAQALPTALPRQGLPLPGPVRAQVERFCRADEALLLSLWDVVMDIQGGFMREGEREPKGLSALPEKTKEDLYVGSYATSATFMHHAFGAYGLGNKSSYEPLTNILGVTLAQKFPYLAAAIIDRHMKRELEAIKTRPPHLGLNGYNVLVHSIEAKKERRSKVIQRIRELGGEVDKWKVKPSQRTEGTTGPRPNTFG